jgi:integrase
VATTLLTQSLVDKQTCPKGKRKVNVMDQQVSGLMLELRESGGRTWYVRYTDDRGKRFQHKLGDAQVLKLSQARQLAQEIKAKVLMGESPTEQRKSARQVPTLAAFIAERYMPYVKVHKRSWITDEILLRCHVVPQVGHKPLDRVTKAELIALFHAHRLTHKPASTNRVMHLLRYVYNLALEWEIPGVKENPTKGIRQFQENNKRERYLTPEEAKRLFLAIEASPNPLLPPIVGLLLLTGARRGEVLKARWEDIHWDQRRWRIPLPKAGEARHIPLSDQALAILASRREAVPEGVEWVFANPQTGKPFTNVTYSWCSAREKAGLADVRMHDLRHSFASFLINSGRSLYEVQRLLGHNHVRTTQRYAHLSQETLLSATNGVGAMLSASMAGPASLPSPPVEVTQSLAG